MARWEKGAWYDIKLFLVGIKQCLCRIWCFYHKTHSVSHISPNNKIISFDVEIYKFDINCLKSTIFGEVFAKYVRLYMVICILIKYI